MEKSAFFNKEQDCEVKFLSSGTVFNVNTPENHPIIFSNADDYKSAMTILAICKMEYSDLQLFAFQIMSNHFHFVIGGQRSRILEFFDLFSDHLRRHFGKEAIEKSFGIKLFPIDNLGYFRNAVAYVNRNGFVVNDNHTPFSYPWGTSAYFFNSMPRQLESLSSEKLGVKALRELLHSRLLDKYKNVPIVQGYISPLQYCNISASEQLLRDAKQYFYIISKNVESFSEIAKSIGESMYYNDNDLFLVATRIAKANYDTARLSDLPVQLKLELARRLHFDFNAGKKQLSRLLKISIEVLDTMFA